MICMSMVSVAAAALYLVPGIFFQRRLGYIYQESGILLILLLLLLYWYLISYPSTGILFRTKQLY